MLLVVTAFLGVLGTAATALWLLAADADHETRLREEQQVAHGITGWMEETEGRIVGQTNWDEALQNLGADFDPEWAHTNIGQFLRDIGGLEQTIVLDAANRPVYGMADGVDRPPDSFAAVIREASPLIAAVRRSEAERIPKVGTPPFDTMLSKPIQSSLLSRVDGEVAIVTATLVQTDFGTVTLAGRAPIVVTVEALNPQFLASFGNRFLLADLSLQAVAKLPDRDQASYVLKETGGAVVARLTWRRQSPGMRLFIKGLPVLAVLVLLMVVTIGLYLRGRRGAKALIASESRSTFMAFHDHLTGLPNRALFHDRLATALNGLQRGAKPIGVFLIDLDRFKQINDCFGHGIGDALIKQVATSLQGLLRTNDTICRLGGDEFAILTTAVTQKGVAVLAERIIARLAEPIDLDVGRMYVGASVGITVIADQQADSVEVLRQADLAMYAAKDAGGSRFCYFEIEMDQAYKVRHGIEADLREALAGDRLTMAYQPQIDARGRTFGVEALVRWNHPERGMVSPATFVAIAEESGLIEELGAFTFRRAFADSLRWPGLKVAVNVSAVQLRAPGFLGLIRLVLAETGADPRRIELEITEGVLLNDNPVTHQTLQALRDLGMSIALDDFGTGYSSLSYLRRYPVDKVKIDRSFIANLGNDREAEAVVAAIVKLARALKLAVIAEGVETEAQMQGLRRAGCGDVQGYLYSKPMPAEEIADFLNREKVLAA